MEKENPRILRQKAEELLGKKKLKTGKQLSENEMQKLVHELEVHQIELELQNEELILAKLAEKKTSEKYVNLYDFAPTGYFTLSDIGIILELNLAGSILLGQERQKLRNKRFSLYISDDSRPVFNQFFKKVFQSGAKESCDIALSASGESVLYVHLTGIASENKEKCMLTVLDITDRKQAEQELISSEKKFKNIFNNSVTGKSITYLDGSLMVNEAFSNIVGYSEKELGQMKWADFTHPDDLERDQKIIESIVEGRSKNNRWEKRYIHKNGNVVWVDISTTLQYDENDKPQYFITSVVDITIQKLAEKKLQEFKEQFSQFMKHSPVYTYIKEVSETESRVLQASDNYREMIGIPGPEMIGKTMVELFPTELAVKITADDWDVVSNGKVLQLDEELNNRHYTTIKFPIAMGDKKLLAGYTIDITERKNAEKEILRSKELLNQTGRIAKIGGWELDLLTMQPFLSDETYRIFGLEPTNPPKLEEVLSYYSSESRPIIEKAIKNAITNNIPYDLELPITNTKGKNMWVRSQGRAYTENEKTVKLNGSIQDITEQKLAENALTESRDLLHSVIENAPIRVFWKDANLRYLGANSAFAQDAGLLSPEELVGKDDYQMGWSEQAELYRADDQFVIDSGKPRIGYEELQTTPDGGEIVLRTSKVPLRDANNKIVGILGIYDDITEKKNAETLLLETNSRHAAMIENIGDVIAIVDIDGIIKYQSPNIEKWFGWKPEELVGASGWDKIHPDDIERIQKEFVLMLESKTAKTVEYRFKCKNGNYKWIQLTAINSTDNPAINGVLLNYHDITNQKKAQETLTKVKNRLKSALDNMSDAVFISDADGNFVEFNDAFASFHRMKDKKEVAKMLKDWTQIIEVYNIDGSVLHFDRWVVNRAINGETGSGEEYILEKKDTGERWYGNYNYAPIWDDKGMITGSVVVAQDITKRVEAKRALRQSEERLKTILDSSPFPTAVVDTVGENIIYWSKSAIKLFGYLPKTSIEWYELAYPDPDYRQEVIDRWAPFMEIASESAEAVNTGEYRITCKDGSVKICEIFAQFIPDNLIVTFNDLTEKKATENKVLKISQHYQALIEKAPDGIVLLNAEGNFKYISPAAKKMFGYLPTDEPSGNPAELTHPDDVQMVLSELGKIFEDPDYVPTLKYRFIDKQGQWHWVETTFSNLLANPSVESIVLNFRDITDRKQKEEELVKSEESYRTLLESVSAGIGYYDLKGNVVLFNKLAASDMNGVPEDFIGKSIFEIFGKDAGAIYFDRIKKAAKASSFVEFEDEVKLPAMSKWYSSRYSKINNHNDEVIGVQIVSYDITELKIAEKSAKESETRFRALHNSTFGGIAIHSNGLILDCNQGLSEITGYTENELIGMDPLQLFAEESHKIAKRNILSGYEEAYEAIGLKKNGEKFPVRVAGKMITYRGQKARVAEFRDITEQKEIEGSLLLANSRNEAILDAIPDIIMEVDVNKVYTWANKEGIDFFGDDVIGKEAAFYFEGEQDTYKTVAPLFKGSKDIIYVESWQRRKDGEKRLLAWQCRMIKDSDGNVTGTLSSALDITDRKKVELELKESEERFKLAMDASKDGLYDWNLVTSEIYYSPGWKSMLGYEDDELPNDFSVFEKLLDPEYLQRSWNMQQELIAKQRDRFELEIKMKHKDGRWVDILSRAEAIFDEKGKAIRIVGTHADITERKIFEKDISESEKKYRDLINLAQEGIWVIDKNNITTFANPSMAKMLKYTQEEMIGKSLFDFMDEEGVKVANENLERRKAKLPEHHDFEFICKNGDRIYCSLMTSPILDKSGNYKGAIAGVMDITERKNAEENIKKLNEELEDKVIERTKNLEEKIKELARMNRLFVGRELRMAELKQNIKELEERLTTK